MGDNLQEIISKFDLHATAEPYGNGHINDTYVTGAIWPRFILQRINHNVFKNPEQVMSNIVAVTEHLRKKIIQSGRDPKRETLTVIRTLDGCSYYKSASGNYYRMYLFIEGARTYEVVEKSEHFYSAAKAFGRFQKLLSDFPVDSLYITIPDFHNTKVRFENLRKAVEEDRLGRRGNVRAEIDFAFAREKDASVIVDLIEQNRIPVRVTHNDTKFNNVMIDDDTGEAVCVIDLDTVNPGSLLYDFGDSIRFGANPAREDEQDLSKVYCDMKLFEYFTRGFIEELGDTLTDTERQHLAFSAKLMTFECGIRFLTDYLNGDTYFKIHYPDQNLYRTRTQFKLVEDMEHKQHEMQRLVDMAAK